LPRLHSRALVLVSVFTPTQINGKQDGKVKPFVAPNLRCPRNGKRNESPRAFACAHKPLDGRFVWEGRTGSAASPDTGQQVMRTARRVVRSCGEAGPASFVSTFP